MAPGSIEKLAVEPRPIEDRICDGARHPDRLMELPNVEAGMTVVDIGAGGGWLEDSDFEIVEESNLMRNYADDHTRPSGGFEPVPGRNSDRFLFVLRKSVV